MSGFLQPFLPDACLPVHDDQILHPGLEFELEFIIKQGVLALLGLLCPKNILNSHQKFYLFF